MTGRCVTDTALRVGGLTVIAGGLLLAVGGAVAAVCIGVAIGRDR